MSRAAGRRPPVHRCGPLSMLAVGALAIVGSTFVDTWRVGVLALSAQVALSPLAARDWRPVVARLVPALIAAASVGWSAWLLSDAGRSLAAVPDAVTAALRILVLVLPGVLLMAWVEPAALGDHLAQRLHLPARPVVAAVAALERLESMGETWQELARARRARGLGPSRSPTSRAASVVGLTVGLLVAVLRGSGRMALAMDARGFGGAARRTFAEPAPWRRADTVLVLVGLLMAAVAPVSRILLG